MDVDGAGVAREVVAPNQVERLAALPLAERRVVPALDPDRAPVIVAGAVILTETLFILLVMAAVLLFVALPASTERIRWRRLAVFGVILALSALVRPISLMLIPVLLVVLVVAGTGWRSAVGYAGAATIAAVLVLMPWTIRNVRATDSFVPISTNLGDNLCMSRHTGATGEFQADPACAVRARGELPAALDVRCGYALDVR